MSERKKQGSQHDSNLLQSEAGLESKEGRSSAECEALMRLPLWELGVSDVEKRAIKPQKAAEES